MSRGGCCAPPLSTHAPRGDVLSWGGYHCPPVPNVVVGESPGRVSFHNITHPIVVPTKSPPLPILPTQGNGIVPPPNSRGIAPPRPRVWPHPGSSFPTIVMPMAPLPRQSSGNRAQDIVSDASPPNSIGIASPVNRAPGIKTSLPRMVRVCSSRPEVWVGGHLPRRIWFTRGAAKEVLACRQCYSLCV